MKPRIHNVEGHGGVRLHVRDFGPEAAPAILLLHGWSQHHLSWSKQTGSALAGEFRLVAPDLRGHGASEKPEDASNYDNSAPWAGDIAAIIETLGLDRPVLVGWSMGGWVVADYLRVHGDGAIAGIMTIGSLARAGSEADPDLMAKRRPDARAEGMFSDDQPTQLSAVYAFIRACFAAPPSKYDLALMAGFNMLCPPHVRRPARQRNEDWRPDLGKLTVPATILYGEAERVCLPEMALEAVAAIPHARTLAYQGAGHVPFWEQAERFNADLAQFARQAHGVPA